jgi:hypothetical protein
MFQELFPWINDSKSEKGEALAKVVILVKTGIQFLDQTRDLLDSRLRGNDRH